MKALWITLLLIIPLSLSAASKDEEDNPPLKQSDLPLPVVIDESQGDVPVTLDGEMVTVTGSVSATVTGSVNATIQEPLEVITSARDFHAMQFCGEFISGNLYDSDDIHSLTVANLCDYIEEITITMAIPVDSGARFILTMLAPTQLNYYHEPVASLLIPPGVTYAERTVTFDTPMKTVDGYGQVTLRTNIEELFPIGPLQYPIMWEMHVRGYNE